MPFRMNGKLPSGPLLPWFFHGGSRAHHAASRSLTRPSRARAPSKSYSLSNDRLEAIDRPPCAGCWRPARTSFQLPS
jgi:hypothetical protein